MFNVKKQVELPQLEEIVSKFENASSDQSAEGYMFAEDIAKRNLIIYGAGSGFDTISTAVLSPFRIRPLFIVDKKFSNDDQMYRGIHAINPSRLNLSGVNLADCLVIVTLGHENTFAEAYTFLKECGCGEVISAFNIYEYHLIYGEELRRENRNQLFLDNKHKIISAYQALADLESQHIFRALLATYVCKKIYHVPSRPIEEQYISAEIDPHKDFQNVIDCGAYDGSISIRFHKASGGNIKTLVCFEPDIKNFERLSEKLTATIKVPALYLYPLALSRRNEKICFEEGFNVNSRVSKTSANEVLSVQMDAVIPTATPSYIKMDIEGSELPALKGAERIIKRAMPKLAISVYHKPSDLWEIINFLDNLNLGYIFYIRNYTSWVSETVLYATRKPA